MNQHRCWAQPGRHGLALRGAAGQTRGRNHQHCEETDWEQPPERLLLTKPCSTPPLPAPSHRRLRNLRGPFPVAGKSAIETTSVSAGNAAPPLGAQHPGTLSPPLRAGHRSPLPPAPARKHNVHHGEIRRYVGKALASRPLSVPGGGPTGRQGHSALMHSNAPWPGNRAGELYQSTSAASAPSIYF